ncbi:hypothetical protein [Rubrivivax gelatinosus]|uniref:hypothetical protein n=1 Tax=Rubrivivax gelatinosus TaxID=28068 RepID=UPI00031EAC02|nr:hypothetical protein [Rubrivivax gelatinosus]MBG6083222.1 hypothetical protein [Rubrivivax gelatinosus]
MAEWQEPNASVAAAAIAYGLDVNLVPFDIELCRAGPKARVRWPAAQAESCAAWLPEFALLAR